MSTTIKFSLGVFDKKNQPMHNLPVVCKAFNDANKKGTCQSSTNKTDLKGKVNFEFKALREYIDVDIEVSDYDINYAFHDGEGVTIRLLKVNF